MEALQPGAARAKSPKKSIDSIETFCEEL